MEDSKVGSGCLVFILGIICAIGYMKWNSASERKANDVPPKASRLAAEQHRQEPSHAAEGELAAGDDSDDVERLQLASEWQSGGKRDSIDRLNAMKNELDSRTACSAYHYAKTLANEARSAIIKFERAIGYDDYVNVAKCEAEASDAMRRFVLNCRWRPGVSRGRGTHMHSGQVEGTWELDSGYVQVGDRVAQVRKCGKCNERGQVSGYDACLRCNGTGKIPNPMAQFSEGVNMVGGMLGGISRRGRGVRFGPSNVRSTLPCDACNGKGRIPVVRQCPQCYGQGKVYE